MGAGIAGLAAAYELSRTAPPGTEILVLEGSRRVGGKLAVSEIAGVPLDEGAEAALARVPEVIDLMTDLGLGADIVYPATTSASIAVQGILRPVPAGTLLGVPADLDALRASSLLSGDGFAAVTHDLSTPGSPVTEDVSVGTLIGDRLGPSFSPASSSPCSEVCTPAAPSCSPCRRRCRRWPSSYAATGRSSKQPGPPVRTRRPPRVRCSPRCAAGWLGWP